MSLLGFITWKPWSSNNIQTPPFLERLPHELWINILKFFNPQDIQAFRTLCRNCFCFVQDKAIWHNLFRRVWPHSNLNGINDLVTFREAHLPLVRFIEGRVSRAKVIDNFFLPYVMNLAVLPSSTKIHGNSTDHKDASVFGRLVGSDFDFSAQIENLDTGSSMVASATCENRCPHYIDEERGLFFEGDDSGNVYVWEINSGTYKTLNSTFRDQGPFGRATSFAIHQNYLFTGHSRGRIQVWDLSSGRCIAALNASNDEEQLPIESLAVVENELVSSRSDGQNMVFDLKTYAYKQSFKTSGVLRFDQGISYCISPEGIVEIIDPKRGNNQKITCVGGVKGHHKPISVVRFILGYLCTGSEDGIIKVWDPDTHQCLTTLPAFANGKVTTLRFADRKLYAGSNEGKVNVFDFTDYTVKTEPNENPRNSSGYWNWLSWATNFYK